MLDRTVRKTLETKDVRVEWPGLAEAVATAQQELVPDRLLEARFYKLLVYMPGMSCQKRSQPSLLTFFFVSVSFLPSFFPSFLPCCFSVLNGR